MMVNRKLDGAMYESSADQEIRNWTRLYITCGKSRVLYQAEQDGWLTDKIWARLEF